MRVTIGGMKAVSVNRSRRRPCERREATLVWGPGPHHEPGLGLVGSDGVKHPVAKFLVFIISRTFISYNFCRGSRKNSQLQNSIEFNCSVSSCLVFIGHINFIRGTGVCHTHSPTSATPLEALPLGLSDSDTGSQSDPRPPECRPLPS